MGSTYTYAAHGCPIEVFDDSNILVAYPDGPGTRKTLQFRFRTHDEAAAALMALANAQSVLTDYNDKLINK